MNNMMIELEEDDCGEPCLCCGSDFNIQGYWNGEYSRFTCPCSFSWEYPTTRDYNMGWAYYTDHMCKYEYEDE